MRAIIAAALFLSLASCQQSVKTGGTTGKNAVEALADCLTEKGVVYYGAKWCGYCQKQQAMFGSAYSRLKHVNCDKPGEPGTDPGCLDEKGGYCFPTWVFPNGERVCGLRELSELAKASGCPYPE